MLTRFFRDFLLAQQPDIVHFQHTIFLGYDILRVTRNTLPDVPIVYTLHEYLPICHRDGQMVRTQPRGDLCQEESPRRCHECFPEISPQTFYMRKRFIQSHLALVDLLHRAERVRPRPLRRLGHPGRQDPGRAAGHDAGHRPRARTQPRSRPRNRFAFFGQLNPYKGADVLLDAMGLLGEDFDGHLSDLRREPRDPADRVPRAASRRA